MHCIDRNNNTLKTLGTHFSYFEKLKEEKKLSKNCNKYLVSNKSIEKYKNKQ